jgi:hypothetical protein
MKELTLEIKPLEGFGGLKFGATKQEVIEYLGEPNEEETFEDEETGNVLICHFWDKATSAFFDNPNAPLLNNLETDNPQATLFGKTVFAMKEAEIKAMMEENGYTELDEEMMEGEEFENEKRVSYDDAMMDFFFEDDVLTAVNWGVFFDEE